MSEHKHHELTLKGKLLCMFGGALVATAAVLRVIYRRPMGIIGAHATGKLLGLGLILMLGPIWSFFRKKRSAT